MPSISVGRLEELAAIFAVDVCGFRVMGNHLHLVLRIRPDVVEGWSDEQVGRRWWRLCPGRVGQAGRMAEAASRAGMHWFQGVEHARQAFT